LTLLYLAKDTVHRWFTRISSPLARVLVVFFLSLSALCALGSYVISTKLVKDKIVRQGGDLVFATLTPQGEIPSALPTQKEISDLLGADSYALTVLTSGSTEDNKAVNVYTYDFCRTAQFMQLMAPNGTPTVLATPASGIPTGPNSVKIGRTRTDVFVRHLPDDHPLMRTIGTAGLILQPEYLPEQLSTDHAMQSLTIRIREINSSEDILRVERYLHNFMKLDSRHGTIMSASRLLGEMDVVLSKQTQCRIAFCVGISAIVGILLTALAGMEYRQNEYIYTLMKSFGIRPTLLVGAFIAENIFIVGSTFAAALACFMYFQKIIVREILKLGNYTLTLPEIRPEIELICYTLLGCILVSAIPIAAAANRDIGRVLK
jgi:hypothetical protein